MTDEEYDQRKEATLTRRLIHVLADSGMLPDREVVNLLYPSIDAIERAELAE